MTEKAVGATFNALFALTDLRCIYREIKPAYKLNEEQKRKVKESIEQVKTAIKIIEEEFKL